MDFFGAETWEVSNGVGVMLSLRAQVAMQIVKHCALVTGMAKGEDSAGRSRLVEMPSADVARRANEIADALVGEWEASGWVKAPQMTRDEAFAELGRLDGVKSRSSYDAMKLTEKY